MNRIFQHMKAILSIVILLFTSMVYGQNEVAEPVKKGFVLDTNMLLIIIAVFLLLPVWMLSNTFIMAAKQHYTSRLKSGTGKTLILISCILISSSLTAQDAAAVPVSSPGLLHNTMTIMLLCLIAIEIMVMVFFAQKTISFIKELSETEANPEHKPDFMERLRTKWTKMNFKPIEEEYSIDTGHSYDGIRELDNVIPPWFRTAFIITILFAAGYLYRYHIAKSAPNQIKEYEIAVASAEMQQEEYLKKQKNNIDESNVKMMTTADIEAGKKTFTTTCAVCHKSDGGGMVGPNLTDDYWLHGGSLKDIFKTIKYGYPEKGMISWKDQLSPLQIAQLACFIKSIRGTNPPDCKAKQGTLYVPEAVTEDSLSSKKMPADTLAK